MGWIHAGLLNKEIAHRMHISEGTVKVYCHNLFRKIHVRSRTQAAIVWEGHLREADPLDPAADALPVS